MLQVDGITGEQMSAHTLLLRAVSLAMYLQNEIGIKSGDVISVCSENRIEFFITIHAAFLVGAAIAPLNQSYIDSMLHSENH